MEGSGYGAMPFPSEMLKVLICIVSVCLFECTTALLEYIEIYEVQCWGNYFLKISRYILLATELFSYSYILSIK